MYCLTVGMYHSETNGSEWTKQQNEWSRSSLHRFNAHFVLDWCYHKVLGLCQCCHHLVLWSFQFIVPSCMVLKDLYCSQVLMYSVDPLIIHILVSFTSFNISWYCWLWQHKLSKDPLQSFTCVFMLQEYHIPNFFHFLHDALSQGCMGN